MMHIVDDNEAVLGVMSDLIESFGYHALSFASSRDYLHYASSDDYQPPKAVFTDVMMPDLDGFTLMKQVRAMHPQVRFIIMSGEDHSEQRDKRGACIYLLKPIRFDKLEATFEHLKTCIECGPSRELSDSLYDDRRHFGVKDTLCPFMEDVRSN